MLMLLDKRLESTKFENSIKGKVKLSLCLAMNHAMKMYRGSGGIAPRILDLGTRCT